MNASLHLLQIVFYFHTLTYVTFAAQVIRSHWDRKPTPGRCPVLMGFRYRHLWGGSALIYVSCQGKLCFTYTKNAWLVPEGRNDSDAWGLPWSLLPQGLTDKKRPSKTELSYRRKFLTIKIHKIVCRNSVLSVNKHQSQQRVKNTVLNITKRQTWAHDHYWWDHKPTWKDLKTKTVISQGLRL